jgi:hypothetical protein
MRRLGLVGAAAVVALAVAMLVRPDGPTRPAP